MPYGTPVYLQQPTIAVMLPDNATTVANEVINLLERKGGADYAGEAITQLEHACQAAQLAAADGQPEEVVLAALLHDIGHLLDDEPGTEQMDGYGVMDHEGVGAEYLLQRGFGQRVAMLIRTHVAAKRYLCAVNLRYYQSLSDASKATLQFQGGPMSAEEVSAFEANPHWRLIIKMRSWDEQAKQTGVPLPALDTYRQMIIRHLARTGS